MSGSRGAENIVLTGFMGTGKSAVGKKLAHELGLGFFDMDELIEKETGKPIREIFKAEGEARFREIESRVIEKLTSGEYGTGLVVSTGGGAVVDPENRRRLKGWGTLVCLKASVDAVLDRVEGNSGRPLLDRPDKREFVERLMAEREEAYAESDIMVDTTGRDIKGVVRWVKEHLGGSSREAAR